MTQSERQLTRERLAELLNEDLSREYQPIIAYVVGQISFNAPLRDSR
jgi:hypothetical protein